MSLIDELVADLPGGTSALPPSPPPPPPPPGIPAPQPAATDSYAPTPQAADPYAFTKEREGFRERAYADHLVGSPVIGYGTLLDERRKPGVRAQLASLGFDFDELASGRRALTRDEAERIMRAEAPGFERMVRQRFGDNLTPDQKAVLFDMAYQGGTTFLSKDLTDAVRAGDTAKATAIIREAYPRAQGLPGLKERADLRANLFAGQGAAIAASSPPRAGGSGDLITDLTADLPPLKAVAGPKEGESSEGFFKAFWRGLHSGTVKQNPEMLGTFIEMVGNEAGVPAITDGGRWVKGLQNVKAADPSIRDFREIRAKTLFSDTMTYLGGGMAQVFTSMLPPALLGAMGAGVGFTVGGPPGAAVGGTTGMLSGSYALNTPELYKGLIEDGVEEGLARKVAFAGGVPLALLDRAGLHALTKPFMAQFRTAVGKAIAQGMLAEGATEGMQQIIQETLRSVTAGKDLFTADKAANVANAAIIGALGGGAIGAAGGAYSTLAKPPAPPADPTAEAARRAEEELARAGQQGQQPPIAPPGATPPPPAGPPGAADSQEPPPDDVIQQSAPPPQGVLPGGGAAAPPASGGVTGAGPLSDMPPSTSQGELTSGAQDAESGESLTQGVRPPVVGDYIQWSPGGIDQLDRPARVRGLSPDGRFVFVDGSDTGLPIDEVVPTIRPGATPEAPPQGREATEEGSEPTAAPPLSQESVPGGAAPAASGTAPAPTPAVPASSGPVANVSRETLVPTTQEQPPAAGSSEIPSMTGVPAPIEGPPIRAAAIRDDEAVTPTGNAQPVRYAIVEARDLIASNLDDLSENPAYPQDLQPRDRTRASTELQIQDMLNPERFRPELLGETPEAGTGAPIIAPSGVVESGNGRVMALRRAYGETSPAAASYRAWLAAKGYPVEGFEQPVLVRVRQGELSMAERAAFARDANVRPQLAMSATEQAMADAQRMPDGLLGLYRGGDLTMVGNRPFVQRFLQTVPAANERAALTDARGELSQEGVRRIQAALLARAYGDEALVASLIESADSNVKSIGGALLDAAPQWAQMRDAAKRGLILPEMDVTSYLMEAVKTVSRARDEERNVIEYVAQRDLFGGVMDPRIEWFLRLFFRDEKLSKAGGRDRIAAGLLFYVDEAGKTQPGPSMFGAAAPPTSPADVLKRAREKAYEPERRPEQQSLLGGRPRRDGGDGAGGVPVGEGGPQPGPGPGQPQAGSAEPAGEPGSAAAEPAGGVDLTKLKNAELAQRARAAGIETEGKDRKAQIAALDAAEEQEPAQPADGPPADDDFDKILDEEIAAAKQEKAAPAKKPRAPRKAAAKPPAAPQESVAAPLKAAAKHGLTGMDKALTGIWKALGGDQNKLSAGLNIDEESWAAAKPYFVEAWEEFKKSGGELREFVRRMIAWLRDEGGLDPEAARPFLKRFHDEVIAAEKKSPLQELFNPTPPPQGEPLSERHRVILTATGQPEASLSRMPVEERERLVAEYERAGAGIDLVAAQPPVPTQSDMRSFYIARNAGYELRFLRNITRRGESLRPPSDERMTFLGDDRETAIAYARAIMAGYIATQNKIDGWSPTTGVLSIIDQRKAEVRPLEDKPPVVDQRHQTMLRAFGYEDEAIANMTPAEREAVVSEFEEKGRALAENMLPGRPPDPETVQARAFYISTGEKGAQYTLRVITRLRAAGSKDFVNKSIDDDYVTNLGTDRTAATRKAGAIVAHAIETHGAAVNPSLYIATPEQLKAYEDNLRSGGKAKPIEDKSGGAPVETAKAEPGSVVQSPAQPLSDFDLLAQHGLVVLQKVAKSGKTYWAVQGSIYDYAAALDAAGLKEPRKILGVWQRSAFDADPTAKIAAALRGAPQPETAPAAPAAMVPRDEAEKLIKQAKIQVLPAPGGGFYVKGNTYDLRAELRSLANQIGGQWDGARKLWAFNADPTEALGAAIAARPDAGTGGDGQPAADSGDGIDVHEDRRLRELRGREDARRDERDDGAVLGGFVDQNTRALIERGLKFGIPQDVVSNQIEDVGQIVSAQQRGKRSFVLASEAGSGKTFVLGGAIRELRNRGQSKFVYLTMNKDLIAQIQRDLADYGVNDVSFHTYAEMSTRGGIDARGAVLIFDEAHNVKNMGIDDPEGGSARGRLAQEMMASAGYTIISSATPFENPVEAAYLAATGVFDEAGGWKDWVKAYGASVRKRKFYNPQTKREQVEEIIYWTAGKKEDGAAARQWFVKQGIFTQRPMRIDPKMVDVSFERTAVSEEWVGIYRAVEGAYDEAVNAWSDADGNSRNNKITSEIARHRENTIKRILEASKVDYAIKRAKDQLAAGKNVVIFVETKADRRLGMWRKSEFWKEDTLYTYPQMVEMMRNWEAAAAAAWRMGEKAPPRPFAEFIVEIARFFDEAGIDYELPSVADQIVEALGKDQVGLYTGAVTNKQASQAKADFLAGKKKVLVATMAKGGTGLSLHDVVGNRPTVQININLPWKATGVDQVAGRVARYGLQSKAEIFWLFASNIDWESHKLAPRVGQRMRDMGAIIKGIEVKAAEKLLRDFDFEGVLDVKQAAGAGVISTDQIDAARGLQDIYSDAERMERSRSAAKDTSFGFFETPFPLAALATRLAGARAGDKVLEPSAGTGNLLRFLDPGAQVTAVELRGDNVQALRASAAGRPVEVRHGDFLEQDLPGGYDVILMNPPFERAKGVGAQDVAHVQKAYDLLAGDGRLIAFMGEGAFFRQSQQEQDFRRWLDDVGATVVKLPENAFKRSGTGVRARMVLIDKNADSGRSDLDLSDLDPLTLRSIEGMLPVREGRADLPPLRFHKERADVAEEQRQIGEAYDQVLAQPEGPAFDPLIDISPGTIDRVVMARGGYRGIGDVTIKGRRGWGLVKFIWRHGTQSTKPRAGQVLRDDVLAVPEIVRDYEPSIIERNAAGEVVRREWRVMRPFAGGAREMVYSATMFDSGPAQGQPMVVSIYVEEGAPADRAMSVRRETAPPGGIEERDGELFVPLRADTVEYADGGRSRFVVPGEMDPSTQRLLDGLAALVAKKAPGTALRGVRGITGVEDDGRPWAAWGNYQPIRRLISVVIGGPNMVHTVNHEVIHALVDMGVIEQGEWQVLSQAAEQHWIAKHEIERKYPGADRGTQIEEAVAEAYAAWSSGYNAQPKGITREVARIFQRLAAWLRRMATWATNHNFQTVEDVFRAIERGAIGRRPDWADQSIVNPASAQIAPGVGSPEFKRWFGGSKVVDEKGEPLVVYHGSVFDFDAFDPNAPRQSKALAGTYSFSDTPSNAGTYAAGDRRWAELLRIKDHAWTRRNIAPSGTQEFRDAVDAYRTAEDAFNQYAKQFDAELKAGLRTKADSEGANIRPVYLSLQNPLVIDAEGRSWFNVDGKQHNIRWFTVQAQKAGHDGLIVRNLVDSGSPRAETQVPQTTYIAFRPEQIKSVFNRGTWDPARPEIMYQRADEPPLLDTPAATPEEMEARKRARQKEEAEARMLGRKQAKKPQQAADELPLFGGPRQRSMFQRANLNVPPALQSDLDQVMVGADQRNLLDRIRDWFAEFRDAGLRGMKQGFLDEADPMRYWEEIGLGRNIDHIDAAVSGYKMRRLTPDLGFKMRAVMFNGPLEIDNTPMGGTFRVKAGFEGGFLGIFKDVVDAGLLNAWKMWAIAKRAERLLAEGRERLVDDAKIQRYKDLDQQYPIFREAMDRWIRFNRAMLDMAEQAGLINAEQRAIWEKDDYVPFYRVIEDAAAGKVVGGPALKGSVANQRSGIKRLRGGEQIMGDIIENMVKNMTHLVDASYKNLAMQRFEANVRGTGVLTEETKDWTTAIVPATEAAARLRDIGVDVDSMDEDQRATWLKLFTLVPPRDKHVVSLMRNGKIEYYRVHDPLLLRSLTAMRRPETAEWGMNLLRGAKRTLTTMVTADPAYMVANLVRDTLGAKQTTGEQFQWGKRTIEGLKKALDQHPSLVALMAGGGMGSSGFYPQGVENVRKFIRAELGEDGAQSHWDSVLNTPAKLWHFWQRIGASTEQANRIAVYESVKARGGSEAEAIYQSRDLMDFAMRGDYALMRVLTEVVPFLNSRVQGLYKLWRAATRGDDADKIAGLNKQFLITGGILMSATLALMAANWDNDEYWKLKPWQRDTYYHFWVGGQHFQLPKPFEIGAIFSTLPERLAANFRGPREREVFGKALQDMFLNTFSMNPTPQLVKPILEQVANRDWFRDTPIINLGDQRLRPEAQYDERTSEVAKHIGAMVAAVSGDTNPLASPKRIEHLMRGYFGTLGMYLLTGADAMTRSVVGGPAKPSWRVEDIPVVSRFIRQDPALSTRWVDEFYDLKRDVDQIYGTIQRYRARGETEAAIALQKEEAKKLALRPALNALDAQLDTINKQSRAVIGHKTMSSDEKRERYNALIARRNALVERVEGLKARLD